MISLLTLGLGFPMIFIPLLYTVAEPAVLAGGGGGAQQSDEKEEFESEKVSDT